MTPLSRLQALLADKDFDAILLSSEINQRYLSGFSYTDGYQLVTKNAAFLFTDPRYDEAARARVKDFIVLVPKLGRLDGIAEVMQSHKMTRVAIEEDALSYADFGRLSEKLPATLVSGASEMLSELRRVKSDEELSIIERAQTITDRAFSHILNYISPRVTEREVAMELEFFMRREGAEAVAFSTIAVSGTASSLPHGEPRDLPLQKGFLTMDFGAQVDGYCSDMTRTVVIGRPDEEMRRVYETVLGAQRAALDFVREDVLCREVDAVARRHITDAGYGAYFTHSLGHGIGMLVHESPSFSRLAPEDSLLSRGNVMSVEPGIYLEGRYGVRIEDMIAVRHDGSIHNFTKSPKELIEL